MQVRAPELADLGLLDPPAELVVSVGDTVIWQNDDILPHTSAADSGAFWTKVTTAHVPFPRYDASMVYSVAEKRIIMFGGWVPCGSAIICAAGDTWG